MTATISGDTGIDLIQDGVVSSADLQNGAVTGVKLSGAQTGSAPVYGCRAWALFNGTSGALTAGGNVTSVTRNGVGDYTVTFTTAMQDTNYSAVASCTQGATGYIASIGTAATGSVGIKMFGQAGTSQDSTSVHIAIFR